MAVHHASRDFASLRHHKNQTKICPDHFCSSKFAELYPCICPTVELRQYLSTEISHLCLLYVRKDSARPLPCKCSWGCVPLVHLKTGKHCCAVANNSAPQSRSCAGWVGAYWSPVFPSSGRPCSLTRPGEQWALLACALPYCLLVPTCFAFASLCVSQSCKWPCVA